MTGAVIFPQVEPAVTYGSASTWPRSPCSLPEPTLCATVLSDFEVREFPVPGVVRYGRIPLHCRDRRSRATAPTDTTARPPPYHRPPPPPTHPGDAGDLRRPPDPPAG